MHTRLRHRGFTLIELLVVVSIIVLLIAILLPSLNKARETARRVVCMSNMRQIGMAFFGYINDNRGYFPAHRDFNYASPTNGPTDFWASALLRYTQKNHEIFHCPSLRDVRDDYGQQWQWSFDKDHIGYGYNAYFLGLYAHLTNVDMTPALSGWMSTSRWTLVTDVKSASMTLLVGDSNPIPVINAWSSTLWWPKAAAPYYEGVNTLRHDDLGAIGFTDGHSEARRDEEINPTTAPRDTGDDTNVQFWDPQLRHNPSS